MNARQRLIDAGCEDAVLFEHPTYDDALIGVDSNGRAVYDYGKMMEWMVDVEGLDVEAADDWICYNTLRALPWIDKATDGMAPIVLFSIDEIVKRMILDKPLSKIAEFAKKYPEAYKRYFG